jgi:hypothetical protein
MRTPLDRFLLAAVLGLFGALLLSASAQADLALSPGAAGFDVTASEPDDPSVVLGGEAPGGYDSLAGSHPYALRVGVGFELGPDAPGEPGVPYSDGDLRNLRLELPPGFVENPSVIDSCTAAQFSTPRQSPFGPTASGESCPDRTQIGLITLDTSMGGGEVRSFGLFNLGTLGDNRPLIGASPYGVPIVFARRVDNTGGVYRPSLELRDLPQAFNVSGLELQIWGNPWLASHDSQRGNCLNEADPATGFGTPAELEEEKSGPPPAKPTYVPGSCSIGDPYLQNNVPKAYLTLPGVCEGPLAYALTATSWQGQTLTRTIESHDAGEPLPLHGCDIKSFRTATSVQPLTDRTTTSAGLNIDFDVDQAALVYNITERGRLRPGVQAPSQIKRAVVSLPEGVTINPSVGAGLGVCTPAQLDAETATSAPGAGCPNSSRIGEVSVNTPLFRTPLEGGIFLAEPYANPTDSLLAIYLVAKLPAAGVIVKAPGKIDPDPHSGQLVATFSDLPQMPYAHFRAHFREGQRSLLASPASCGDYRGGLDLTPWLDPGILVHDIFFLTFKAGIGGGPCPPAYPTFAPTANAGNFSRSAGVYTPFLLRFSRGDAEQEFTSYSAKLPPGLLAKLSGIPFCPEAAIAAAATRSAVEEERDPTCPAASRIGHTIADYGTGSALTQAFGGLYLAGPYHGAPLSILAVDSAKVGPFDLGVILVRSAIEIDPRTAQVTISADRSDPIPHISHGIPLHLRNLHIYVDRPNFTLNPTSCAPFSVDSVLGGSGGRFDDSGDDTTASVPTRFQVSDCSSLSFNPRIALRLRGLTRRGAYPSLTATVTPRFDQANIGTASVALPAAIFLATEHIGAVCTRPAFAARRCPAASVYGYARAVTPLLDQPLEGPVYLRVSSDKLPELVADISGGGIRNEVVGRIDSVKGGMRATYDVLPDAPVTKFSLTLFGGKRGLLVNAQNICTAGPAKARMVGQNNVGVVLYPKLKDRKCKKHRTHRAHR